MSRLVVYVSSNTRMSRGKYAAQAVHAALTLVDAHPGVPVVVLGGSRADIDACPVVIRDAGATEVEPGTVTAGARWDGKTTAAASRFRRVLWAAFGPAPVKAGERA